MLAHEEIGRTGAGSGTGGLGSEVRSGDRVTIQPHVSPSDDGL